MEIAGLKQEIIELNMNVEALTTSFSGCTHSHDDPFALGKDNKVPCCAGTDEVLKDWKGDGKFTYQCVAKDTGKRCFKEFGCKNPASIDLWCDTDYLCATSCHGKWEMPCPSSDDLGESLGDWKPIPKEDLKCSGSDYVKCLDAYIRPDGVWVLDDYAPWGPKDPECIDWPQSAEQLCNECAGGCIDGDCSTDGQNFCKPPCTGSYEDPYASGKNVPCCDGLEEQLNNWDHYGPIYYKCMDKDAWKPIQKKDLKCSGSEYKCLNGYIRPYDGVWVLEEYAPWGEPNPECANSPRTSEQLCNACAGGCAPTCSTDGSTFCNPPKN